MKEELRAAEEELAAAEAARDEALAQVPNPPHESSPDGDRRRTTPSSCAASASRPSLAEPREHTEVGRFDMERAAALSGSRFGYLIGDTALLAFALYRAALDHLARARLHAGAAARARARGGDDRHRLLPDRALEHLRAAPTTIST